VVDGSPKAYFWQGGDASITRIPVSGEAQHSKARAVAVSGTDVYIAGEYHDGKTYYHEDEDEDEAADDRQDQESPYRTYYWRYGEPSVTPITPIPPPGGDKEDLYISSVYTTGLTILGKDVYLTGYYREGRKYLAYYLQLGREMVLLEPQPPLPEKSHDLRMIRSNAGDFYLTGYIIEGETATAFYWKNGDPDLTRLPVTGPGANFQVSDMEISGGNLYITGSYRDKNSLVYKAYYWTSANPGAVQFLPAPVEMEQFKTSALVIAGNDIYIAGNYVSQGVSRAYFWKSGDSKIKELPVTGELGNIFVSALAVSGDDVYVGGECILSGGYRAYYWKYGDTRISLLPIPSEAGLGEFVVEAIALY
jgi:hypothetical protein